MAKGRVIFNVERCKSCGLCVEACPKGILAIDTEVINAKGYNPAKIVDEEKQFCALTYELPDGTLYIGYEGTDDSMIGWQEDFELIYKFPVPAQKCAISYINKIIKYKKCKQNVIKVELKYIRI